jgi:hypothetical protein
MPDGSIATLEGVLDLYAAAGRTIDSDTNAGIRTPTSTTFYSDHSCALLRRLCRMTVASST